MTTAKTTFAFVGAIAVALVAFAFTVAPASAFFGGSDDTTVSNSNSAHVDNYVRVEAETGDNDANGGDGDDGGDGGDARTRGNGDANGGRGGNGGHGAAGGSIDTGAAEAWGTVYNDVNSNNTVIEGCGCPEGDDLFSHFFGRGSDITVRNHNRAHVDNTLKVEAETGDNDANGGDGDDGGDGGDANNYGKDRTRHHLLFWWKQNNGGDANGGAAGNGGTGGQGGSISTGDAYANGLVDNTVNRNVTRITR